MVSLVSVATLAATTMSVSLVSAASEFFPYAETLANNDVISTQSTEAGYRLGDTITRAELAKVTANLGGFVPTDCSGDVFGDVGASLGDLCGFIEALADAGVVTTANANYRPSANVTRAEMIKMILGAVGETGSDVDAGYMDIGGLNDLAGFINRANELGCAADADYFRPMATASRGEAFKIASCVAYPEDMTEEPTPEEPTSTGSTSTGVVTAGSVTVSLEGTATAQYVPKNASSVKVGTVKLMAGTSDVTVSSLTVSRSGLGNASDILAGQGIRAAQNGVIVSSSSDYYNSTSQKGNVYFYPALKIAAGTSQTVDILVNLSGAENSQHQFTLDSVNAGTAGVTGAPITLGLLNTTSYVTSSVAVSGNYSYAATPGKTQQTIAKVDFTAGSRDITLGAFTLTRSGSNDLTKKFANVAVFKNGVKVADGTLTSDKLSVVGLAHSLAAGNFQSFEIKADVLVDGTSTSTLQFKIDSPSDVSATEVATGFPTQTDTTAITGNANVVGTVTFNAVDVTYTKQSTANQTIAPGASNVTLFDAKVTSTVPLNVRALIITPTVNNTQGTNAFANNQLSVKVNGSEIATITASDYAGGLTVLPTKVVSIPVDSTTSARITIVGSSVKNTLTGSNLYGFKVQLSDVRDSANNSVTLGTAAVTGDQTTIQAPTLTLKNATVAAPSNSTISATTNQEVARFGLTAEGDAIRVTKVVLTGSLSVTGTIADLVDASSIELRDVATDAKIAGTVTLNGNLITVDSMTNDIAKDTTQNIKVVYTSVKTLDSYYGATTALTLATAGLTSTAVNGGSAVTQGGSATLKTYTIGVVPPVVMVTPTTLAQNAKVATIKVTNTDSNTGITLSGLTLQFAARSTANGNFTFSGNICLRDLGSTNSCGSAGTTLAQAVTQAGGTYSVVINPSMLTNATNSLSKNGGYVEYEVYVDGAPLWVAGDNANVTITSLNYLVGATTSTQSYVGVSSASATSTK
jgi:hypothetical protein